MNEFEQIMVRMRKELEVHPGDYQNDQGIWMCGNCNAPRQEWYTTSGGERVLLRATCQCEKEQAERERKAQEEQELRDKIEHLRYRGLTDAAYLTRTFQRDDGSDTKTARICRNYVKNWAKFREMGQGLLFYGDVGTGKSFFACCIANALIEQCVPAMVTSFSRILSKLKPGYGDDKPDIIARMNQFELLVLDDLGVERSTPYALEQLFQMVDGRLLSGKPLIVTTNLSPDDLNQPESMEYKRIYDRLKEMCYPVKVTGPSRRTAAAASRRSECERLLSE